MYCAFLRSFLVRSTVFRETVIIVITIVSGYDLFLNLFIVDDVRENHSGGGDEQDESCIV